MPGGRPTDYCSELADTICERIADGQSVREICRDPDMPAMSAVFRWIATHEEFKEQYVLAREAQAQFLAEEILDIADDGTNDWMERHDKEGEAIGWRENGEAMQRSRLRVDTRKWVLSKLLPKKYGDKITNEHTGPNGGPIKTISAEMTAEQATETYQDMMEGE